MMNLLISELFNKSENLKTLSSLMFFQNKSELWRCSLKETRLPTLPPNAFVQPTLSDERCQIIDDSKANNSLSFGNKSQLLEKEDRNSIFFLWMKTVSSNIYTVFYFLRAQIDHNMSAGDDRVVSQCQRVIDNPAAAEISGLLCSLNKNAHWFQQWRRNSETYKMNSSSFIVPTFKTRWFIYISIKNVDQKLI